MTTTYYDVIPCTECEANEVLAPVDSTDAKCDVCADPDAYEFMMNRVRVALGLTAQ